MSKVQFQLCDDYEPARVRQAVRCCLEQIPAIQTGLQAGKRVLLKPNLINPNAINNAACTHPQVVRAVAEMACEAGCEVIIADEPGYAMTDSPEVVFQLVGIAEAVADLPVTLELLKRGGYETVPVPNSLRLKSVTFAKHALEADLVINLAKCKTHQQTLFTGAIKNMFGGVAPRQRIEIHLVGTSIGLAECIADVFSVCVPQVNLMDAVVGMEGKGPSHGKPVKIGAILASEDAVALDTITAEMCGIKADEIDVITAAVKKQLGCADLHEIEVAGGDPAQVQVNFVRPPGGFRRGFPSWVGKLVGGAIWVRPVVKPELCIRCGACKEVCPGNAIEISDYAKIDYKKCVECFCCQEVCPKGAIDTNSSWLARKMVSSSRTRSCKH